jgi:iron complex outermembrane receptor protein
MFYGTYSTGHKGVAYDLTSSFNATVAARMPVPGETAKNFEIGTKAMLLDGRASINVALFDTNFYGFQYSASHYDTNGKYITELDSIGQLRTSGLEVDGSFRVSKSLLLTGSLARMDAVIKDFPNGPCYVQLNAAGTGTVLTPPGCYRVVSGTSGNNFQDLAGKTLPNAPKVKANLGGQYDLALAAQSFNLFFTGNYRWQSATQFSLNQDPGTIQKAFGIFDAGVGMKDKKDAYKVSFFVKNLLNQHYATGVSNNPSNGTWNIPSGVAGYAPLVVSTTQWIPARDYQRYFGASVDVSF